MHCDDGESDEPQHVFLVEYFRGEFGSASVGPNVVVVDQKCRITIRHFYLRSMESTSFEAKLRRMDVTSDGCILVGKLGVMRVVTSQ